MINKKEAFDKISKLIERFDEQKEFYKKKDYNETLTRIDFINPYFKALGWDIDNEQGFAESYREVIHEDKLRIGSQTKAPDYSFKYGEQQHFLLQKGTPYKNYINKEVPMLENLVEFYKRADGNTKRKILGCIFSEKLIFEKGKSYNRPFSKAVSILLLIIKELQGSQTKMEVENDLQSIMAPPSGLEPETL